MDPVCLTPPSSSVTDNLGGRGTGAVDCRCNLAASVMRCASARTSCAAWQEKRTVRSGGQWIHTFYRAGFLLPPENSNNVFLFTPPENYQHKKIGCNWKMLFLNYIICPFSLDTLIPWGEQRTCFLLFDDVFSRNSNSPTSMKRPTRLVIVGVQQQRWESNFYTRTGLWV